jgi:hypothetical protein
MTLPDDGPDPFEPSVTVMMVLAVALIILLFWELLR